MDLVRKKKFGKIYGLVVFVLFCIWKSMLLHFFCVIVEDVVEIRSVGNKTNTLSGI